MSTQLKLEIARLAVNLLTPLVAAWLGVRFLRQSERIRSEVTGRSRFSERWADQFFESCTQFTAEVIEGLRVIRQPALPRYVIVYTAEERKEAGRLEGSLMALQARLDALSRGAKANGKPLRTAIETVLNSLRDARGGGQDEAVLAGLAEFRHVAAACHEELLSVRR